MAGYLVPAALFEAMVLPHGLDQLLGARLAAVMPPERVGAVGGGAEAPPAAVEAVGADPLATGLFVKGEDVVDG